MPQIRVWDGDESDWLDDLTQDSEHPEPGRIIEWMDSRNEEERYSGISLYAPDGKTYLEVNVHPDAEQGYLFYDGFADLMSFCGADLPQDEYGTLGYRDLDGPREVSLRYHVGLEVVLKAIDQFVASDGKLPVCLDWIRSPEQGLDDGVDPIFLISNERDKYDRFFASAR